MAANKTKPKGRKSDKMWRDAVHRAVKRMADGDDKKALERLADKLIAEGLDGNMAALREIGDRLDGKPAQSFVGEDDGPLTIQIIKHADNPTPE